MSSSPSELPSDSNICGHLPLRFNKTDVMFRDCSLYEEQWRAVYNIGSTRTTPQEKVLFIGMCTSEIRYRHPWLNSSVQHRVECIFAGTGASALRKSGVQVGCPLLSKTISDCRSLTATRDFDCRKFAIMSAYKYPLDVFNLSVTGWISGFLDWNTSGNSDKVSCLLYY